MKYEEKLLIEICKLEGIKSVKHEEVDWVNLLIQAMQHRVIGTLYRQFSEDPQAPRWFKEIIRNSYFFQNEMGKKRFEELNKILSKLEEKKIDVIALKGMYLVPNVYKDFGLREFSDLDVLAKNVDVDIISDVLCKECGYIQGEYDSESDQIIPCDEKTLKQRAEELQHDSEFLKVDKSLSIVLEFWIEVHRRLETVFDRTFLDVDQLFENKIVYNTGHGQAYRLSNEDMIIHLCYHNYWHTQSLQDIYEKKDISLRNYMDIRQFVRLNKINWDKIICCKNNERLWYPICYSLYNCHLIFNDVLPSEFLDEIDPTYIEREGRKIYDRWITKRNDMKPIGEYTSNFLDRIFDQNRYLKAISCCDLSAYEKNVDVQTYFEFFTNGHILFKLGEIK